MTSRRLIVRVMHSSSDRSESCHPTLSPKRWLQWRQNRSLTVELETQFLPSTRSAIQVHSSYLKHWLSTAFAPSSSTQIAPLASFRTWLDSHRPSRGTMTLTPMPSAMRTHWRWMWTPWSRLQAANCGNWSMESELRSLWRLKRVASEVLLLTENGPESVSRFLASQSYF